MDWKYSYRTEDNHHILGGGATTVADDADAMFDWGEPSIPNGITTLCENKSDVEPKMMLASSARNPSKQEVDRFLVDNRA
jgi:hypothetical protein